MESFGFKAIRVCVFLRVSVCMYVYVRVCICEKKKALKEAV